MIPADRTIIEARLVSHCRAPYNEDNGDRYFTWCARRNVRSSGHLPHVAGRSRTATIPPSHRTFRRVVRIRRHHARGEPGKPSTARSRSLASSSRHHNGKIWDPSFGRADWYDPCGRAGRDLQQARHVVRRPIGQASSAPAWLRPRARTSSRTAPFSTALRGVSQHHLLVRAA